MPAPIANRPSSAAAAVGLFLLALAADVVHPVTEDLRRVLLPAVFLAWPWIAVPPSAVRGWRKAAVLLVALALGLAAARAPAALAPAVAVAFFGLLAALDARAFASSADVALLLRTAGAYSVFTFVAAYVPAIGNWLRASAALASKAETAVATRLFPWEEHVLVLGPTAYGLSLLVVFALFALFASAAGTRRPVRALAIFLGGLLLVHAVYLVSTGAVGRALHGMEEIHALGQLDLSLLFFALATVPTAVLCRALAIETPALVPRRVPLRALAIFGVAFVLACPLVPPWKRCRVLFADKGTLDLGVPHYGAYGDTSGGMFGELPAYLAALGHEVVSADPAQAELEQFDVLIFANLLDPLEHGELHRVRDFIHRGGGLILVADHTGGEHIQDPSNQILEGTGIQINFDTASPRRRGWRGCMEFAPHAATRWLSSQREISLWLGASLAVEGRAEPLMTGDLAYSDLGTREVTDEKRGYLGDLKYHPGEVLGDIVVGATDRFGAGRVVVIGDTSPLQNGALMHSWRFVDRAVRWVAWRSVWSRVYDQRGILAAALAALLALALRKIPRGELLLCAGVSPLVALLALPLDAALDRRPGIAGDVAWIDGTHQNRHDTTGWEKDSVGALGFNLSRAGLLPFRLWRFDELRSGARSVLLVDSPARSFTGSEIERLEAFLRAGGRAVILAGWEDRVAAQPLLAHFGLELAETPLGSSPGESRFGALRFYRANPLRARGGAEPPEVIATVAGHPVIVERAVGAGRLVVIADSCFLKNKNLEDRDGFLVPENIEFLRKLLEDLHTAT